MNVLIVTPATTTRIGNGVTADRWARILRSLGHRVKVACEFKQGQFDLLVALHAVKSSRAITHWRREMGQAPVFVALTGTDIYRDRPWPDAMMRSLEAADRLIALQPLAVTRLPRRLRQKTQVIYQSVLLPSRSKMRVRGTFRVVVVGNLRAVKDPFRTAMAVRNLPAESTIQVFHYGAAMSDGMRRRAEAESERNHRYRWVGERSRGAVLNAIASSDLCVLTSRSEGGANVVGESIVAGTPVISSRIDGSVGLLGKAYPGLFPVGDTEALRRLLLRAERDSDFRSRLAESCRRLKPLFSPREERQRWSALLKSLLKRSQ